MIAKPEGIACPFATAPTPEALAALAFDRAPFGLSLASALPASFGRYVAANPAFIAMTGYDLEGLLHRRIHDVVYPGEVSTVLAALGLLARGELAAPVATGRLLRRDGSPIDVREQRSLVCDDRGDPLFFLTRTDNVRALRGDETGVSVERRDAESALRDSESRYRMIAEYAADMIVRTRADRTRSYVSPASKSMLGYEPHEIIDLDFARLLHPDDRAWVGAAYDGFLAGGERDATHAYRLRHKNDVYVWVEAHWVAARRVPGDPFADGETAVISIVRDISERKAAEAQISLMARRDPLSGLANRELFSERLAEALALVERGGIVAVVSIDLDDFKNVNDTLGHAVGDALLRAVADRLRACVRKGDTVARLGGDEFAIILIDLHASNDATINAARILDVLAQPYDLDGQSVSIGASIGITTAPADGTKAEALLKNADLALYRAKGEGRKTFRLFEPEMLTRAVAKRTLESDLQRALVANEFCLFYQPMVAMDTRAIVAFEALVRWCHPERGLVMPGDFIAVAEETGAIVPLGEWILGEACRTAATWPPHVRLAVNLSPVQFKSGDLYATVVVALTNAGLDPRRLDLEITESVLFLENEKTLATLADLRALGVGISLDDFGTGYSSLRYIRSLRFDKLKIDRSFVMDMMHDVGSAAIVHAVIGLGESLGIATIAEGIETSEQFRTLRAKGCTEGQGYLVSKPLSSDAVATFLENFTGGFADYGASAIAASSAARIEPASARAVPAISNAVP